MELVSVPAVLLNVSPAAVKNRLLSFLTRNHGTVRLFARPFARRAPATGFYEAIQGGELTYSRAHAGATGRLLSFAPQRVWPGIRGDFHRIVQALAFLELVNLCATEGEAQPEIYDLFVRFLDQVERDDRPEPVRLIATLQLLHIAGFDPCLDGCVVCGRKAALAARVLLAPEAGGIICRPCATGRRERTVPVSPGARTFMQRALGLPEAQLRRLRASAAVVVETSRLLAAFIEARVGTRPRAGAFIEAMRER